MIAELTTDDWTVFLIICGSVIVAIMIVYFTR